ncbi:protein HGH1 homolog [Pyrgilauda ruficollis]|uniref:protein HGH1 homolog n=1 Tax=Pyrgilauda ruficollis TaxID=221976 RepID=UPI001B868E09|nr:protein HGH1 homolog [Pyrgilauda ruficollis]
MAPALGCTDPRPACPGSWRAPSVHPGPARARVPNATPRNCPPAPHPESVCFKSLALLSVCSRSAFPAGISPGPAYPPPIGSSPPPPCIRGADWLLHRPTSPLPSNAAMAADTKKAAAMEDSTNEDAAAAAALSELTALLSPSCPAAPEAAEAALALSGSASGRALLAAHPAALSALSALAASASRGARPALSALVNASSEPAALEPLLAAVPSLLPLVASSGAACGVLANLSRGAEAAPRLLRALGPGAEAALLRALSAERPRAELGALLCNLSQAAEGRGVLLEPPG